jgi:hypothetical protein
MGAPLALAAAGVDVGDMHLDDRAFAGLQRVQHRHGEMAETGGIDDDPSRLPRLLNPVDHLVLTVGLAEFEGKAVAGGDLAARGLDVGQGLGSIDVRLALAQKIQVGPVQQIDGLGHPRSSSDARPPNSAGWPYCK